jgi:nitroimidazol reductase NimA-like FMN-containing flavoprotein (pyridoxamine 5'-phosphate oxidase superfamily)
MKRAEKEIRNRVEIDEILKDAQICRIALARDTEPYIVPLFFGYDGARVYFHTANEGKKLDFIAANNRVCFEIERKVTLVPHESEACSWSASYESVIGYGRISEMPRTEDKVYALDQIMLKYSGRKWNYNQSLLESVKVWCVEIDSLTGKRSKPGLI